MQASLVTSACVLALSGCGGGGFLAGENLVDGVDGIEETRDLVKDFVTPQELMACGVEPVERTQCMTEGDYLLVTSRIKAVMEQLGGACDHKHCKQADWAGCVLRMAGHDFMDYEDGNGGSDGCTNMEEPDNKGLKPCLASGEFGFSLKDIYGEFCDRISLADFLVIAAEAVMDFTRDQALRHEAHRRDPSFASMSMDFKRRFRFGRTTNMDCKQTHEENTLPNAEGGCDAVEHVFVDNLGLSWEQAVALMGVHSLGRAKKENSGFDGFWSDPEHGRLFNNNFFKSLVTKGWQRKQLTNGKHQFVRIDAGKNNHEMMLSTDLCLVYKDGDLAATNGQDCCAWVHSHIFPEKGVPNVVDKEAGFCGEPCTDDPQAKQCNAPGKERKDCCGDFSTPDCGSAVEPTGNGVDAALLFAHDEKAWIEAFRKAWELATTKGAHGLQKLKKTCV